MTIHVEDFALDHTGLDHFFSQHGQTVLIAQRHAHIRQSPQQQTLRTADVGQRTDKR